MFLPQDFFLFTKTAARIKHRVTNDHTGSYYLDGNVVTYLWDSYTNYKQEGKTGGDISLSPFAHTIISEYTLDELITIPISNAYKKHLVLLSIFSTIPVFKPITGFTKPALDSSQVDDILASKDFLGGVVQKRAKALALPQDLKDLEQDIKNKEDG